MTLVSPPRERSNDGIVIGAASFIVIPAKEDAKKPSPLFVMAASSPRLSGTAFGCRPPLQVRPEIKDGLLWGLFWRRRLKEIAERFSLQNAVRLFKYKLCRTAAGLIRPSR